MIAAEGEHKASRALRMAAEVIMDSPAALQVGFDQDKVMMMVMMMIVDSFAALQVGSHEDEMMMIVDSFAALQAGSFISQL